MFINRVEFRSRHSLWPMVMFYILEIVSDWYAAICGFCVARQSEYLFFVYVILYVCVYKIITLMQSVSISTLRGQIKKYCDLVTENFETVIISRTKTEDSVVMISLSEYNSIQETLHLLSTQANRDSLAESIAQAKAGHLFLFPDKGNSTADR